MTFGRVGDRGILSESQEDQETKEVHHPIKIKIFRLFRQSDTKLAELGPIPWRVEDVV